MLTLVALGPAAVGGAAASLGLFPEAKESSSSGNKTHRKKDRKERTERDREEIRKACNTVRMSNL